MAGIEAWHLRHFVAVAETASYPSVYSLYRIANYRLCLEVLDICCLTLIGHCRKSWFTGIRVWIWATSSLGSAGMIVQVW